MAEGGNWDLIGPQRLRGGSVVHSYADNSAPTLNEKDFKFRFKRLPNTDAIENGYCGCCFVSFRRLLPNGVKEAGTVCG